MVCHLSVLNNTSTDPQLPWSTEDFALSGCLCSLPGFAIRTIPPRFTRVPSYNFDLGIARCLFRLLRHPKFNFHPRTHQIVHEFQQPGASLSEPARGVLALIGVRVGACLPSALTAHAAGYLGSVALSAPSMYVFASGVIPSSEAMVETALDTHYAEAHFRAFLEVRQAVRSRLSSRNPNQPSAIFPCFDPQISRQHLQRRLSDINRAIITHRLQTFCAKTSGATDAVLSQRLSASSKESVEPGCLPTRELGSSSTLMSQRGMISYDDWAWIQLFPLSAACAHTCLQLILTLLTMLLGAHTQRSIVQQVLWLNKPSIGGIKSMEPGASRTPVIRHHPLFVETNSNPKLEADIQSIHLGSSVLLDVTFTSKPASSRGTSARDRANAAERRKLDEVSKGLEFPPSCSIPMALDNMGTWSDAMLNYFVEAANEQSILPPGTLLHRARILSSLAICAANSLYLQQVRYGRKSES